MNPWRRNPFFRICIPFTLGIASGNNRYMGHGEVVLIMVLLVMGLVLVRERESLYTRFSFLKGFLLFTALFLLGHTVYTRDRQPAQDAVNRSPLTALGEVRDTLRTLRFGSVDQVRWTAIHHAGDSRYTLRYVKPFHSRVFIPVKKRITAPGDKILVNVSWSDPEKPVFQGAFNEQAFLRAKGQYVKAQADHVLWVGSAAEFQPADPVTTAVHRSRGTIRHALYRYIPDTVHVSIMQALLIGDRKDMPDAVRHKIAGAGLAHVLAVSGLHVGIVFWILNGIFQLVFSPQWRKWVAPPLLILALGWYALLTGLSPSVVRAVLMIALVLVAGMAGLKGPVMNTVLLAGFLMLSARPHLLFNLGFQLSFLAVLGILWCYPQFIGWYYPKGFIARRVTDVLYVSLAAQLATCPLTMAHFGQFPTYFLVANLLITPLLILSLYTGILLIISHSAGADQLAGLMGKAIARLMDLSVQGISFLEKLPAYLITDIFIPVYYVIPLCLFIGLAAGALFYRQRKLLMLAIIPLVYVLGGELQFARKYRFSAEIVGMRSGQNEALMIRAARRAVCIIASEEKENVQAVQQLVRRYRMDRRIQKGSMAGTSSTISMASGELCRLLEIGNDTTLILLGVYPAVPERTTIHDYVVEYIPEDQWRLINPDNLQGVDHILLSNRISAYRMGNFKARLNRHGFAGKIGTIR